MILNLEEPKEIVVAPAIPQQTIMIDKIEVLTISDDLSSVKAAVIVNDYSKVITLWEGEEYENIGDWTQEQANARIIELL